MLLAVYDLVYIIINTISHSNETMTTGELAFDETNLGRTISCDIHNA